MIKIRTLPFVALVLGSLVWTNARADSGELQSGYEAFLLKNYANTVQLLGDYKAAKGDSLQDYYLWALGRSQVEMGDLANGQIHLEELLKVEPDSLFADAARVQIGRVLQSKGNSTGASEYLQKLLPQLSEDTKGEALYYLGLAELASGATDAGVAHLKQVYLQYPTASVADQALDQIQKAAGQTALTWSLSEYLSRAEALFKAKSYGKALEVYEQILGSTNPQERELARVRKGECLYNLKRYGDAELFLDPGPTVPAETARGALLHLGMSQLRNSAEDSAIATFERLQRLYPGTVEAEEGLYRSGMIALQAGRSSEAATVFSRLGEAYPHGNFRDKGLWAAAWEAFKRSDWPASLKLLVSMEQGATDAATQGKAIYWQADIAAKQGKSDEAKTGWQRTAQISPLSYYGFMALKKLKGLETLSATPPVPPEWKQAPAAPTTAAGNSPTDKAGSWDLHFRKAVALTQSGLGRLAQAELEASLRQNADKAAALGHLLEASRKTEAYFIPVLFAQKYWDRFKSLFSSSAAAENYRNHLQYPFAYRSLVLKAAAQASVSPPLVVALMRQESGFMPWITSGANAQGLMQLLPATANNRARSLGIPAGDLFDPNFNILIGAAELKAMLDRFSDNWAQGFAAYNAGPAKARQWADQFGNLPMDEFIEEIPFSETNLYVKLVLRNYWVYQTLYP